MKKSITWLVFFLCPLLSAFTQDRDLPGREQDSLIVATLGKIRTDSMQSYVQAMQDMGTRFMMAPNRKDVAYWIMDKFISFGIEEVRIDSFLCYNHINWPPIVYDTTTWQYNVEAKITGIEYPDEEVILIGHYDDVVQDGDPMEFAPGADDNASGTAAALECARVIMESGYAPGRTLIFLASAAEELMYYGDAGTEHYAEAAQATGRNIVMAINNDMIAWNDGSWTIDLFNHSLSPQITDLAINIIENYTSLNYESWDPVPEVGGDIQPFLDAGYQGIYFMEHYINPNYHKITDVVDNCDFSYLAEATKVSLGCILYSDISVGIEKVNVTKAEISIYPNPASADISFQLEDQGPSSWSVYITDMNGKPVYQGRSNSGINRMDISFLEDGFYVMIFSDGRESLYRKLVVAKE